MKSSFLSDVRASSMEFRCFNKVFNAFPQLSVSIV